jgi:SAM-dependent methyltransferase
VCLEKISERFADVEAVELRRCSRCRSLFAVGLDDDAAAQHGSTYARDRGHGEDPAVMRAKRRTFEHYLRQLGSADGRRLLEVGCSTGDALLTAAELGWQVSGIEVNAAAAKLGNDRLGGSAIAVTSLEEYEPPPEGFDAVVMFDVVEHLADPREAATRLAAMLRPGGHLLLITPDADSFTARLMGRRWPHLLPEHRVIFSRDAIESLLSAAGFYVELCGAARKYLSVGMFERHVELYPHVFGAPLVRWAASRLPDAVVPLYVGEMVVRARAMSVRH